MNKCFAIVIQKNELNVYVNVLMNNIPDLELHTILPDPEKKFAFRISWFIFRVSRKLKIPLEIFIRSIMKRQDPNAVYLAFGGQYADQWKGKTLIHVDDPYFKPEEIARINRASACCVTTEPIKRRYMEMGVTTPMYVTHAPFARKVKNVGSNIRGGVIAAYYAYNILNQEIEIIRNISERMAGKSDFQIWVIGKCKSTFCAGNVTFFGRLSHDALLEKVEQTDIGLYLRDNPVYNERLTAKIMEMTCMGMPIVSIDVSESFPVIENENGFVVPSDEIPAKVLELYESEELRKRFSENALRNAKKYDKTTVCAEYRRIIDLL